MTNVQVPHVPPGANFPLTPSLLLHTAHSQYSSALTPTLQNPEQTGSRNPTNLAESLNLLHIPFNGDVSGHLIIRGGHLDLHLRVQQGERQGRIAYSIRLSNTNCCLVIFVLLRAAEGQASACSAKSSNGAQTALCLRPDSHKKCLRCGSAFLAEPLIATPISGQALLNTNPQHHPGSPKCTPVKLYDSSADSFCLSVDFRKQSATGNDAASRSYG